MNGLLNFKQTWLDFDPIRLPSIASRLESVLVFLGVEAIGFVGGSPKEHTPGIRKRIRTCAMDELVHRAVGQAARGSTGLVFLLSKPKAWSTHGLIAVPYMYTLTHTHRD